MIMIRGVPTKPEDRELTSRTGDGKDWVWAKGVDIPLRVNNWGADLGFAGSDAVERLSREDKEKLIVEPLGVFMCRFSLIAKAEDSERIEESMLEGRPLRIATSNKQLLKKYLGQKLEALTLRELGGAVESTLLTDEAQVVADLVETGKTIRNNNLVELEVLEKIELTTVWRRYN